MIKFIQQRVDFMTKNRKVPPLVFSISLASIIAIVALSYSRITLSQSSMMPAEIIVEDNSLDYSSTLVSLPQQLMALSEQVSPRTIAEYSCGFFKEDLHISSQLLNLTEYVSPRFRMEYTSEMFSEQLPNPPDDLEQITSHAKPRIVIEYSTTMYTTSLVHPMFLPWVIACNEAGQHKDIFDLPNIVYILGANLPSETNVTIYIIPNNMSASPDNAIASCWILTGSNGELPLTLAWESPLSEGHYDLWVDVNQNGMCEETIDIYANSALDIDAFTVVPEFPSFLILPLFMISTLLATILYRRKHSM